MNTIKKLSRCTSHEGCKYINSKDKEKEREYSATRNLNQLILFP